jgi:outer membrane lipoprotein-sorting protein
MKWLPNWVLLVFAPSMLFAQAGINPEEVLRQAESKRSPWESMSFYATIRDSGGEKGSSYHLFVKSDKFLIFCSAPLSQRGNLLLGENHALWFYIRSTAQAIRMTPLQRLSGSVSFADMAGLSWTRDFTIDSFALLRAGPGKEESYYFQLKARSPDIAYRRIKLWINKKSRRPVKAELFLQSEKLYKTVLFTRFQVIAGKEINTQIEFTDHFNKERKSVLDFSKWEQERKLPDDYFKKEKLPDLSKELGALPG